MTTINHLRCVTRDNYQLAERPSGHAEDFEIELFNLGTPVWTFRNRQYLEQVARILCVFLGWPYPGSKEVPNE